MKKALHALTAILLLASFSATASATQPFQGSTVLVPPALGSSRPTTVMTLPVEAGYVSEMVPTNAVAKGPSWIAKGDKYYSLCMPSNHQVSCAPIVARSIMRDIEVSAYASESGKAIITFHVNPATTRTLDQITSSTNYFLARISKQAAHFNRTATTYKPPKKGPPLVKPPPDIDSHNIAPNLIVGGGTGCSYDDFDSYDCAGGDSAADNGGYDSATYDWSSDSGNSGDGSNAPPAPSFPAGNDNGDSDPCVDSNGNNICQKVVITGERPEQPEQMSCIVTPWAIGCEVPTPPIVVGGDPTEQLPKGPTPWLPQSACDFAPVLCSAGQIPVEKPPPLTDWEREQAKKDVCYKRASANLTTCYKLRKTYGDDFYATCRREAMDMYKECDLIGKGG